MTKFIKKIFQTTSLVFIILVLCTISMKLNMKEKVLRTNLEIEDFTTLNSTPIYLINQENYLVRCNTLIDKNDVKEIINYLQIENNKIPQELNGYIPSSVKLIDYQKEQDNLTLNFSKELLNQKNIETIITGITYSLLENNNIKTITIKVEDKIIYQNLNKKTGINKYDLISNNQDIKQIIVYYLDKTNTYYVPITEYKNDNREKIEIIIEELKNTKENLISLLSDKTELESYREEGNTFLLNFNHYLIEKNKEVSEKILNTIAYSVFDNYDVNTVMFEIEGIPLKYIEKGVK